MTATDNATSIGVMTPDKKTIFVTKTQGSNVYGLRIIQLNGQTFSPSDMVGTWRSHGLASSSSSAIWMYDLSYINSAGDQTHVASINSMGNTTPSAEIQALTLGPTGTITESGNQDMHGQASFNKDVAIATKTRDGGFYALNIILKQ